MTVRGARTYDHLELRYPERRGNGIMQIAAAAPPRPSVLVIDDSNLLRGILKEELEAEGYEVHLAENGERGLEMARDLLPDLILLDVGLPELDGYEVCRQLKNDQSFTETPILFLSARNELKDKMAGFDAGADDYMSKPFFTKELLARMRTSLRNRESLASSRRLGQYYLEMLFSIGSAITSPFKLDDEIEIILRQALVAVSAPRGSILLLDPEENILEVKGSLGYDGAAGPQVGERHRISDKLPLLDPAETETSMGIRMYEDPVLQRFFVPMVAKERLIGGIEIEMGSPKRTMRANDQKLLYALASQAAIFIENARLERDVRSMFLSVIVSMAGAVDAKDAYTHGHSLRVARMSLIVAQELGLPRDQLEPLLLSAILHDVGKIAIPDNILKKPERLDREEFEIMKGHPEAGARLLQHIKALGNVIPGILHHHEYWNGTGYPHGLSGERIPLQGRIIHIGDAFDAMTTDRIYRRKVSVRDAMEEIGRFAGTQFDPGLVDHALRAWEQGRVPEELPDHTPTLFELIDQIK